MFTMTEVECLGACVNAPILQINDDFYEDVDFRIAPRNCSKRCSAARRCRQPGSMTGRQTSAPAGGPNTLTSVTE